MRVDALLELYKAEKEQLDDPLFGVEFPSFKEWVANIRADQEKNHRTVDTDTADKLADRVTREPKKKAPTPVKKPAAKKKAPAKKKVVKKKAPAKKKPATVKKTKTRKSRALSKVDKSRNIYNKFCETKTRKEIITKFVAQCNLTPAGAATYYQKFKAQAGE